MVVEPRVKQKYPRALGIQVAQDLVTWLKPCCERLIVAGSLRRRKAEVGDVELVYIPRTVHGPDPADLFGRQIAHNAVDVALGVLLEKQLIAKRPKTNGQTTWGPQNKLATHLASGMPVDLFSANHENWWNLVVCRTGGKQSNVDICEAAIRAGWKWNPYGDGFSRPNPERGGGLLIKPIGSEREVFEFVGLDYLDPWERK